jgi:hypothetical protein
MSEVRGLKLKASAALKEKRLAELLATRPEAGATLEIAVDRARVLGSLELSGLPASLVEVDAALHEEPSPGHVAGLVRGLRAVDAGAPFSLGALRAWHAAVFGRESRLRTSERERPDSFPAAPARFIESRLGILAEWIDVESGRELAPAQQGALVLARIVEILPFDEGNGRVSRLAASHVMVRAGARPPILTGSDRERLDRALAAAFLLATERLAALLDEASERALDVSIGALSGYSDPPPKAL